ncbi:MAG: hypothetical protein ACM3MG_07730 [Bacillota bacterium]
MNHRQLITFLCVLSIPLLGHARAYIYEKNFRNLGKAYIKHLEYFPNDDINSLPANQKEACLQRYGTLINDALLDIRISIGYFDWTIGKEVHDGTRNYGFSPSLDLGAYEAIKYLLTSRCSGNTQFCGFNQEGNFTFTKNVNVQGRPVRARILMNFASNSEFFNDNLQSSAQAERTKYMENFWSQSLQNADASFYFGHSRNGGGPDFAPPILIPGENKVNYKGYYEVYRPGFKKMLAALGAGSGQTRIIGLMSCDSRDHFLSRLRTIAPRSGVITSTNVVTVERVYTAMIGAIDALLRGQCQKSFYKEIRMTSENAENITMDGVFE